MVMDQHLKEMQLFSTPALVSPPWPPDSPHPLPSNDGPSLDLQLSISVTASLDPGLHFHKLRKYTAHHHHEPTVAKTTMVKSTSAAACVEALKWQAAEQIRLAAMERAYAERVRELTRQEMELAQSEFARARQLWERAREEAERADRMKERAAACMELTCHSCRRKL